MAIGKYCQLCGEKKKAAEIIAEAHGFAVTSSCLIGKVYGDPPLTAGQMTAAVRFCRNCGAELARPRPEHCPQCGAAVSGEAAAQDLATAGEPADLRARVTAFLLDLIFMAPLGVPVVFFLRWLEPFIFLAEDGGTKGSFSPLELFFFSYVIAFLLYHTAFTALLGRSLGKMILGLRIVLKDGTTRIGLYRSFVRSALYVLTIYVFLIGLLLLVYQEPREKWRQIIEQDSLFHNPLTDTVVVKKKN